MKKETIAIVIFSILVLSFFAASVSAFWGCNGCNRPQPTDDDFVKVQFEKVHCQFKCDEQYEYGSDDWLECIQTCKNPVNQGD